MDGYRKVRTTVCADSGIGTVLSQTGNVFLHEDLVLGVRTTNYKLTETEAARSILSFHLIMKSLFILLKS